MTTTAVIFDMDGLLLDTERACLDSFMETRRAFGLSDDPEAFLKSVGLRGQDSDRVIRDSLGATVDARAFMETWDEQVEARLHREIPVKEGALELVRILASNGHAMGVATSTRTARARAHLDRAGLLPCFQTVIGGDLVRNGKPDPEVYHAVASSLGVSARGCIAFEDSETGTRAALASGARTVQVPDLVHPTPAFAAHGQIIASSLLEGAVMAGLIASADIECRLHGSGPIS